MGKKYVASAYGYLGQLCDTEEDAKRAARGIDYQLDGFSGWSTAFNLEVDEIANVTEIEDSPVTKDDFLKAFNDIESAKRELEQEFAKIRRKHLAKFEAVKYAYINLNTTYNYGDKIKLITKRSNGRKRVVEGVVCGAHVVRDTCEIRPDIRGINYPVSEPILSIEVIEQKDFKQERQRVICNNCIFFEGHTKDDGYNDIGFCKKHDKQMYYLHENEYECYENNPNKKK